MSQLASACAAAAAAASAASCAFTATAVLNSAALFAANAFLFRVSEFGVVVDVVTEFTSEAAGGAGIVDDAIGIAGAVTVEFDEDDAAVDAANDAAVDAAVDAAEGNAAVDAAVDVAVDAAGGKALLTPL